MSDMTVSRSSHYTGSNPLGDMAKLVGAGIGGAFATIKISQLIEHPSNPILYDCKPALVVNGYVLSTSCQNWNVESAFALGIGLPVAATVIHLMRRHQQSSAIRKICNVALFGMVFGGSVCAAFGGEYTLRIPTSSLGPIILTWEELSVKNWASGAVLGGAVGFTAETIKQIFYG